jgi:putative ABC transport system ATP-binding protein
LQSDVAVRCEGLVRTYRTPTGEVQALRDVSASFRRGAVTAVIGPSGSGKSSLLRLIAGLDRPTAGSLRVEDRDVGHGSAHSRRRLRRDLVGFVFQRPSDNFLGHLTVGEHLRLAARGGDGVDGAALLDLLGIGEHADRLPSQLSGGEQQRAAFAQALATGARIVVADEPTAELDTASAEHVLERIGALAETGVTFVLATHDPDVMATATARLELVHGRVRGAAADPDERLRDPVEVRWPGGGGPAWLIGDEPVLRLDDVEKSYGDGDDVVRALRGVSLEARPGSVTGLVGRSGSGKTTLLNVAAGWERSDAGTVRAPGGGHPDWSQIAVVPQRLGLMEELSAGENVEYPARIAGVLADRRDLVEDLIRSLGLESLRDRYPRETSLGEQQRTAVARALVLGPSLLIADEPTGHQDAGWAARVMELFRDAAGAGTCCLLATHDEGLMSFLDRTVPMSDGRLGGSV